MSIFSVKVTKDQDLRMLCETDKHSMQLDEPKSYSGNDIAMNLVEAMLSAFGACECMNAWIFTEKFKINLNKITVDVQGEIGQMDKIGECIPLTFDSIHTTVKVDTDNTEEEIEKLIEYIEMRYPVRNTIVGKVPCTYELVMDNTKG